MVAPVTGRGRDLRALAAGVSEDRPDLPFATGDQTTVSPVPGLIHVRVRAPITVYRRAGYQEKTVVLTRAAGNGSIDVFLGVSMRADRHMALLDFLMEAVAVEGTAPFPAHVLGGLRRVARCEVVSYREWSPQEQLESSLAADAPEEEILRVWAAYPQVRHHDPLHGGAQDGACCLTANGSGRRSRSPTSSAIVSSAAGVCAPRSASRSACAP